MTQSSTSDLTRILPPDVYQRFQAEVERQQTTLDNLVREAIEEYLAHLDDEFEDTPDDYIEAAFRQGWHEAMTGQTVPAREALAALRNSGDEDDDES